PVSQLTPGRRKERRGAMRTILCTASNQEDPPMPARRRALLPLLAAFLSLGASLPAAAGPRHGRTTTALDRYVARADPSYSYRVAGTTKGDGYTAYVLEMISQEWRSAAEVDRTKWQHWLTIVQPDQVRSPIGFLFITGGSNGGQPPGG